MGRTIVLSGGGTAGHINPAIALAERLAEDGYDVRFAGTPDGLEARLVPEAGIDFTAFEAKGFDRKRPWTLVTGSAKIARSAERARKWFAGIEPACVVGFGGYVSIPVTHAAERLGIPVVVHEQNSVMGMANRYVSKKASAVCLTYPLSEGMQDDWMVIGNPVRRAVMDATREEGRSYLGIPDDATVLVVFGGSLGAQHLNTAIAAMKDDLLSIEGLHVVHVTGRNDHDRVVSELALDEAESARWHVKEYEDRMGLVLAAADAVVSRAGATSLAEIAARDIPAVLVPYPFARADHQTLNARSYAESGAAVVIADSDVEGEGFHDAVMSIASDGSVRQRMREAAASVSALDATTALAQVVESFAGRGVL